jgi:hypothetical protein
VFTVAKKLADLLRLHPAVLLMLLVVVALLAARVGLPWHCGHKGLWDGPI